MNKPPVWIQLPAGLEQDLDWKEILIRAEEHVQKGHQILWDLELGLTQPRFSLEDEFAFHGIAAALKLFTETVFTRFQAATLGAVLFKGPLDLRERFHWSDRQQGEWEAWQKARTEGPCLQHLFCLENYIEYFHVLAHRLPDELALYCLFDAKGFSRIDALHLLSQKRFQHFKLGARGIGVPFWGFDWREGELVRVQPSPRFGLCLPEDLACSADQLQQVESLLQEMEREGLSCRVVNEECLTEEWDGLEGIAVLSEAVSPRGKRKLMGFCASGGMVMTKGKELGLPNEVPIEKLRGRGI